MEKKSVFSKKCLFSIPIPKPLSRGERLCMLGWLCIVQSLCAYTPGIRAGAECGAAALTKQGRLQSVAHSRCTMQRHQRLTTRIGATPKAWMLWLLAKSFARCKTSRASNARHPFLSTIEIFRLSVISFLCCLPYCNNHRFMVKLCTESFSAVNEIKILHYCKYQTNIRKESI